MSIEGTMLIGQLAHWTQQTASEQASECDKALYREEQIVLKEVEHNATPSFHGRRITTVY